jgi:D-hydroxyproline dehydrogenase
MPEYSMTPHTDTDIAVIGAGVVGLSCALQLAARGHAVTLVAPADDGTGASYGNAGIIADYAVLPVGTPDVLRDLPALLFSRTSPLAIRRSAMVSFAPWLLRFMRECLPGRAQANASAIASLLAHSLTAWRDMATQISGTDLIRQNGALTLYERASAMSQANPNTRRALGVRVEMLTRAELGQLEPALPAHIGRGAAFFPDAASLRDPAAMLDLLRAAVAGAGVARLDAVVTDLRCDPAHVRVQMGLQSLRALHVVLAAGAWSRALAAQVGDRVALDTERGYHLEYDMDTPPVQRPISPSTRGYYFSPMTGRLRVAGTVELGGLNTPASPQRWQVIEDGVRAIFPDLTAPARRWMGFRPSLPDSKPVIGPAKACPRVIHAFGHGHLGLTLAPITARIVADLIAGRATGVDLTPFAASRF